MNHNIEQKCTKRKLAKALVLSAFAAATLDSHAIEQYEPQLPGVTEGVPAGALPPPGVYGDVEMYTMNYRYHDNSGNNVGVNTNDTVVAPMLLWNTGVQVLGADYGMQIIQPLQYTNVNGTPKGSNNNSIPGNGQWGTFNTILVPAILGWHLPNDFHVKTALQFNLPNASSYAGKLPSGAGGVPGTGTGNGFFSFIPNVGVSWLSDGWNLSANLFYSFNSTNTTTNYQSGQLFQADYTAAKTINNWTVGLGAFQATQVTNDSGSGAAMCQGQNGCKERRFGLGPLVAYDFGNGVKLKLNANWDVQTVNAMGGTFVNLSLFTPLKF